MEDGDARLSILSVVRTVLRGKVGGGLWFFAALIGVAGALQADSIRRQRTALLRLLRRGLRLGLRLFGGFAGMAGLGTAD